MDTNYNNIFSSFFGIPFDSLPQKKTDSPEWLIEKWEYKHQR